MLALVAHDSYRCKGSHGKLAFDGRALFAGAAELENVLPMAALPLTESLLPGVEVPIPTFPVWAKAAEHTNVEALEIIVVVLYLCQFMS